MGAKRDFLKEEIKELTSALEKENKALKEATEEREKENALNIKTIKTAKEGFEAVNKALLILKAFYKQAAKAALVQVSESPLDAEGVAPEVASGSYQGNQS